MSESWAGHNWQQWHSFNRPPEPALTDEQHAELLDALDTPPRVAVLNEASALITGDRNQTYGSPTENFANTAALWNVQIGHKLNAPLTAADVAQLMVQLKMARMIAQPKRDNYVDAAGYLACGWECEE